MEALLPAQRIETEMAVAPHPSDDTPQIAAIVSADEQHFSKEKILQYSAAAEQKFSHSIAKAILEQARRYELEPPAQHESKYHLSLGIEVEINHQQIKLGSARYMEQQQLRIPQKIQTALESTRERGHSAILMAIDDQIAGLIER
ncbi:hypothetical protein D5085_14020 [Ectothiorhodospiraceae bacterium BW-2]|nr:hypothetical protein D5085_14020 [Ectothiorhodospiraceae bacterium BW-2]